MAHITNNYVIQCTDVTTGQTGDFIFDVAHWQATGEFKAISPIFPGLVELFTWDNANGHQRKDVHVTR